MENLSKVLGIFFLSTAVISIISVAWPKITRANRPPQIQKVYEEVVKTPLGRQAASVLGVESESASKSYNMAEATSNIVGSLVSAFRGRIEQNLTEQAAVQVSKQFDILSDEEKKQIQEIICKPEQ